MKILSKLSSALIIPSLLATASTGMAYPLDGYEDTGIRRVEGARLANEGLAAGSPQPPGAMLTTEQVDLRLTGKSVTLPAVDPAFAAQIKKLLGANSGNYGICLLYTSPSPRDKRQSRMPSSA